RDALQLACAQRTDAPSCAPAKGLAALAGATASALTPIAAVTLPCGSFVAERSVLSQLRFLDGGVVKLGGDDVRLRASLR
ncbi:hypothetical protein, partial [Escherichia coli]|uniref:hypothetical protein n=2 Tax=Gammaproteobacteria TaxID=1236 RepID=UPI0022EFEC7C